MALTTRLAPIKPISPPWGSMSAFPMIQFPIAASTAITAGDVIAMSTGGLAEVVNDEVQGVIMGFAAGSVGTTHPDYSGTLISIYPALPGALFEGNMVGGTNTDYTGAQTDIGVAYDFIQATIVAGINAYDGAAIDKSDTTGGSAMPLYFTRQRSGAMGVISGVDVVNPRVAFCVTDSIFVP